MSNVDPIYPPSNAGGVVNSSANFGPGGMPRSHHQQQLEEMLMSPGSSSNGFQSQEEMIRPNSRTTGRASSAMSFGRRISSSSVASGRGGPGANNGGGGGGGFFAWGKKLRSHGMDDFDDDEGGGGGGGISGGGSGDIPDLSMGELTALRDRDRYPTMGPPSSSGGNGARNNGRTMSISSTMSGGGFDTTPIIPTLRNVNASGQSIPNNQYRKNLTNARKQALRSSDGLMYPAQGAPPNGNSIGPATGPGPSSAGPGLGVSSGSPGQQQRPYPPGYNQRPPSQQSPNRQTPGPPSDARLRTMSGGPNPNMDYVGPLPSNQQRTMSMTGPGQYPPNGYPMNGGYMNGYQNPNGYPNAYSNPNGYPPNPNSMPVGNAGPAPSSNNGRRVSRPPSRLSQSHSHNPMVTASTMTDPIDVSNVTTSTSSSSSSSSSSNSSNTTMLSSADSLDTTINKSLSQSELADISELRSMNKALLDEVRLVTSELADSIRRELGIEESGEDDSMLAVAATAATEIIESRQRAQKLIILERELDLERRKRMIAQQKYDSDEPIDTLTNANFKLTDLEKSLAEKDRLYNNERRETQLLRESISALTNEFEELQIETNQLKNGILPELKSHVADLELLTAAGNPIELLKQIEELKVENKKLQNLVEENSMRGPLGEKIKAVESQRDALREALRSLRERNDHEIRQSTERVRQLEARLEKEKVISNQMQRKLVQTRSASNYVSSANGQDLNMHNTLSSSSSSGSLNSTLNGTYGGSSSQDNGIGVGGANNNSVLSIPKRRGVGTVPGIVPPAFNFGGEMPRPASPVSFEISQDPAWIDYVNPSKIPVSHAHSRQFSGSNNSPTTISGGGLNTPIGSPASAPETSTGTPLFRPSPRHHHHNNGSNTSATGSFHTAIHASMSSNSLSLPNGRSEQLPLSLTTTST